MPLRRSTSLALRSSLAPLLLAVALAAPLIAEGDGRPPVDMAYRRAFVTSTTYTGNLGGLAGADAKCQAAAAAANLENPTGFVAWLSDTTTDAYCRFHGLTGKLSANCGQTERPPLPGPWLRTDGVPFAHHIGWILVPLAHDELGDPVPDSWSPWTNTLDDGSLNIFYPGSCGDWTSASTEEQSGSGSSWATRFHWTRAGTQFCSTERPLICLETGAAWPLPPYRSGGALAFVTSAHGSGNLGSWPLAGGASGIEAGDAVCRSLAADAGLPAPDSFVAWLSTGWIDAVDRLTFDGPWVRIDGVLVASNKDDLVDGHLRAPINVSETGYHFASMGAWTGTADAGVATGERCGDWMLADGVGMLALETWADARWTAWMNVSCGDSCSIYCFSNFPAVLFVDGFESWSTGAWDGP